MSEMNAGTGRTGDGESELGSLDDADRTPPDTAAPRPPIPPPPLIPTLPGQSSSASRLPNSSVNTHANTAYSTGANAGSTAGRRAAQRSYRSEQARSKSVYRKANPWWRRALRGIIGLSLLAGAGLLVYLGVGLVQDFLGRERLPSAGAEVPEIASASFQITSAAPAPAIDGTLSIDLTTLAFEFVGRPTGPQEGLQVVSPDGGTIYVRATGADWRAADPNDAIVGALQSAIPFLRSVNGPDDVLENRLRQGSVELVDQVNEGIDDDEIRHYELALDTDNYSSNWPLQWNDYIGDVVPAIQIGDAVPMTMSLDNDNVVVRLDAPQSSWAWERLTYSTIGISIADPTRV